MAAKKIALVGCGSQAKYAIETISLLDDYEVTHVLSPEHEKNVPWLENYNVEHISGKHKVVDLAREGLIDAALICVANATYKKRLYDDYVKDNIEFCSIIHPRATIAKTAKIAEGVLINAGAVVQPFASIGMGSMIHTHVDVEHDCQVGDWANLGPGARLAGWVTVGDGATVFTGANVIPCKSIGEGSVVGAGATIIKDVDPYTVVVGVPAHPIRTIK